jgi:hypothetical protein
MFITLAKLPSRKFITTRTLLGLASGISHYMKQIFLCFSSVLLQLRRLGSATLQDEEMLDEITLYYGILPPSQAPFL